MSINDRVSRWTTPPEAAFRAAYEIQGIQNAELSPEHLKPIVNWLQEAKNQDFSAWEDARGDSPGHWTGLENCIELFTQQKYQVLTKDAKLCAREVLKEQDRRTHATTDQKAQIARAANTKIRARLDTPWADASLPWLEKAVATWVPRIIALEKKGGRNQNPKSEKSETAPSVPSTPQAKRKRGVIGEGSGGPPAKHSTGNASGSLAATQEQHLRPPILNLSTYEPPLVEHEIEIRFPAIESGEANYITIGVAAILVDEARLIYSADVRADHLSFQKLIRLIETDNTIPREHTHIDFDERSLWYLEPWEGGRKRRITDDVVFRNAIGVLYWNAWKSGAARLLPLTVGAE